MKGATGGMIAVDWGTSSLRAYHLDGAGRVHDRRAVAAGILTVKEGDFAVALAAVIGDWLADGAVETGNSARTISLTPPAIVFFMPSPSTATLAIIG